MSYIGNQPLTQAFVTDQFSGNGTTTDFNLSIAPATAASLLVAISGVIQDPSTYTLVGQVLRFLAPPPVGTRNISCRHLSLPASNVVQTPYRIVSEFTATAGQTVFTPSSYTPGYIDVFRNGVRLGAANYVATNGITVTLNNPATVGDLITIESFFISNVLNAVPAVPGSVVSSYLQTNISLNRPIVTNTIGVGGATPSTSGAGVTFPAALNLSTDPNTLDDYEEGTWTPVLSSTGGAMTYTLGPTVARYTRVGNRVFFSLSMQFSGRSGGSSNVTMSLPFQVSTAASYWQGVFTIGYSGNAFTLVPYASSYTDPGRSDFFFRNPADQVSLIQASQMNASGHIICGGQYEAV